MSLASQDILTRTPPPADARLRYGDDPLQFGDLRLPAGKGRFPVLTFIHGGFWRARYDLAHAGHLCAALAQAGVAAWNLEYRRVGNHGGGWPGTFEDILKGYRFLPQLASRYRFDLRRAAVMGHSAGGQLALCLAGHNNSVHAAISLAGVVDLEQAWKLHLSNDAVVDFLGGTPPQVPDHYREADPMQLKIAGARQCLVHGSSDDIVPPSFSAAYVERKRKQGEDVQLLRIAHAGHFELIDPGAPAWAQVERVVLKLLA